LRVYAHFDFIDLTDHDQRKRCCMSHAVTTSAPAPGTTTRLFQLAWPITLEMLLGMSLVWVDSAIINHKLGTESFTAVQLSGQVFNLLQLILNIVATGVAIVVSHQIGAKDREGAGRTASQALGAGLVVSLVLMGIVWFGSPFLLGLLGAKGSVLDRAVQFSHILATFLPVNWLLAGLGATMRATGDTRRPMYANVLINLLNALFNWTFVVLLGKGIYGSAMGTSLARLIGLGLMSVAFIKSGAVPLRLSRLFRFDRETLWRIARMGLPGAAESISYQASQFVLTMIVAPLGTVALAARSLTFQAEAFTYIPSSGLAGAASILVGQRMGARDQAGAVATGGAALRFGLLFTGSLALLLFLFPQIVLTLFTNDPAVLAIAAKTLRIASLYKLGQSVNIIAGGIFRGAGNPTWPTGLTTVGTWLITVPLAWTAVHLGFGLPGVLLAMFTDETVRGLINLWYFRTPRWQGRRV
jgi:putative MATE family efflux protein